MGYKLSYTGSQIDTILQKSQRFDVNDHSWIMIKPDIKSLNITDLMKPGNYVFNGELSFPALTALYAARFDDFDAFTTTGYFLIIVEQSYNIIYQTIHDSGNFYSSDHTMILSWVRQSDYTYKPYYYYLNEPGNMNLAFMENESKYPITQHPPKYNFDKQLRLMYGSKEFKYYDSTINAYKSVLNGYMSKKVYGDLQDVYNYIQSQLNIKFTEEGIPNFSEHIVGSPSQHLTSADKTALADKPTTAYITEEYNAIKSEVESKLTTSMTSVIIALNAIDSRIATALDNLTSHVSNADIHPSASQKSTWNSNADRDHIHTKDEITINTNDVIGDYDNTETLLRNAAQRMKVVHTHDEMLALTLDDVNLNDWVFCTNEDPQVTISITAKNLELIQNNTGTDNSYKELYVVSDVSKLGTMAAFTMLTEPNYDDSDIMFSNFTGMPTTTEGLGLDTVSANKLDTMNEELASISSSINTDNLTSAIETLKDADYPVIIETLIDAIDAKIKLINSIVVKA